MHISQNYHYMIGEILRGAIITELSNSPANEEGEEVSEDKNQSDEEETFCPV